MATTSSSAQSSGLTHRSVLRTVTYDKNTVGPSPASYVLSPTLHQYHLQSPEYHLNTPQHVGSAGPCTPINSATTAGSVVPQYRRPLFSMLASRLADKVSQVYNNNICLSVSLSVYMSLCMSICLSDCLCAKIGRLNVIRYFTDVSTETVSRQLFVSLSVYISPCLSVCLPVFLYVSVCMCLCLSVCAKISRLNVVRYFTEVSTETVSRQLFVDSERLISIIDGQ